MHLFLKCHKSDILIFKNVIHIGIQILNLAVAVGVARSVAVVAESVKATPGGGRRWPDLARSTTARSDLRNDIQRLAVVWSETGGGCWAVAVGRRAAGVGRRLEVRHSCVCSRVFEASGVFLSNSN
ncbi:unnamed protein product [Cuscuta epithymum]|uniref:Uncharacterized protein n=1 Tax=Cuscuta epithymum TaxID=186058 RepID=A0AAV0CZX2_9ASTE|nr:unnamed protein product [Cuscuta epithymum]